MLSIDAFRQDSELVCPNPCNNNLLGCVEGTKDQQPYAILFEQAFREFKLKLFTILEEDTALTPREVGYYGALFTRNTPGIELPPNLAIFALLLLTVLIRLIPATLNPGDKYQFALSLKFLKPEKAYQP